MHNTALKRFLTLLALLCVIGAIGAYLSTRPEPAAGSAPATLPAQP